MRNTADSLLSLMLLVVLLSFFPSVSHADAVDDAIERHQQESAQRHADKQLNDALDKARGNTQHTSSSGGSVFGTIIGYLVLAFFVLLIAVFFLSKIADALDFFGIKTESPGEKIRRLNKQAEGGDVEACQQLLQFADNGDTFARACLRCLVSSKWVDSDDAFQQILLSFVNGDVDTQALLGSRYMLGDERIPKSYAEAAKWLGMAVEQGHSGAQSSLEFLATLRADEQCRTDTQSYLKTLAVLHKHKPQDIFKLSTLTTVRSRGFALQFVSDLLKNDKEVVLEAVKNYGRALEYAGELPKNDKEVVLEAVKQNGSALEYAGDLLKNDKEVVLEAVKQCGRALEYAGELPKNDKEVVLEAVKQDGFALEYAGDLFNNDKEVVLEAAKQYIGALEYAGENIRKNKQFILEAVKQNGNALRYVDDLLKNDKEVVLEAVKQDGEALDYAGKKLMKDKLFILEVEKLIANQQT